MRTVRNFPRQTVCLEEVGIIMPDGIRLSARIWLPKDAETKPVPAIVEHLPYRKRDGTTDRDALTHPWFAGHGYACIRVDMRGNGESLGLMDDEYTQQEWADAITVIKWAAAQKWCTGKIGMMGISWGGFNALQVAALNPPELKAIITLCSTADRYADDIHYKGGCLLNKNVGWAANMLSYSSRPPDKALVGKKWRKMWLERLEAMPDLAKSWLTHSSRDAYWKHGSVCEDYTAIKAAVLSIGGWHDGYRNTPSHLVSSLKAPVKAIVGPWIHKYPHDAGPQPAIGFLQEAKRWWDRWLKDQPTNVENDPAMRLWLMNAVRPAAWHDRRPGRWIAEAQWPAPGIKTRILNLGADGIENGANAFDRLIASPQNCGLSGGEYFPSTFGPELPADQRADDALSACFDSAALASPLDVVGAPAIRLSLSSDKQQANVCVRLCDVHPDGASELISYGVLNLCHAKSHEHPQALVPGAVFKIAFDLDQCAYRVPAGHKLRIAVSNSYWPAIWPSPAKAALRLRSGQLDLPTRKLAAGDEWQFEQPQAATPWPVEQLRPASSTRRIEQDIATGRTTLHIFNDFGNLRDLEHGLENGSSVTELFSIGTDDPSSARSGMVWEQTGGRGAWQWRTLASCTMRSTPTHLTVDQRFEAFEGNKAVFANAWRTKVVRRFL